MKCCYTHRLTDSQEVSENLLFHSLTRAVNDDFSSFVFCLIFIQLITFLRIVISEDLARTCVQCCHTRHDLTANTHQRLLAAIDQLPHVTFDLTTARCCRDYENQYVGSTTPSTTRVQLCSNAALFQIPVSVGSLKKPYKKL